MSVSPFSPPHPRTVHVARASLDLRLLALLALLLVMLLCAPVISQGSGFEPAEMYRVIHLWVDPYYGDDALALANNPNGANPICSFFPARPHDVVDPAQGNTVLLHASWPFKTITAAVAYLGPVLPLPNMSQTPPNWTWEYAIIHLLPGRYHSFSTPYPNNLDNGLQGNGETFPINLPDQVSIQGTSALNTIIDLNVGYGGGPAFQFAGTGNAGTNSFIDSVSIHGAIHEPEVQHPSLGSAIYMAPGVQCEVTITNCFLFGNEVGILMEVDMYADVIHQPMIINNTIVWNTIGLWNGQIVAPPAVSTGMSKPIVINNIFDASHTHLATRTAPSLLAGPLPRPCTRRATTQVSREWIART